MEENIVKGKAVGGKARAAALSAEDRKEIARNAAQARWEGESLPVATHEGELPIGESLLSCGNLPDGRRIITQSTFLKALGRSRSPKAGTGVLSTVDDLPFFLQANVLKPFISEELSLSTRPIFYKSKQGKKVVGYDAALLPKVAEVYLKFRDDCLSKKDGDIPKSYAHIVRAADVLMRGLAHVGIIALVDEATGFQQDRARGELAKILEAFVAKELQPWIKTFPDEYYEQMFRLRGWEYKPMDTSRPGVVGKYTNNLVYERLAPGVLEELRKLNPINEKGRRSHKLFQKLTPETGHPKLKEHISNVVVLMKASPDWDGFRTMINRALPRYSDGRQLLLTAPSILGGGTSDGLVD